MLSTTGAKIAFQGFKMEPIRHTLSARLGLLKMYREDLDELVGMFERSCEKVTISDSTYRFDSLEEMKEKLAPRIKDLDIRGENPGVRFLFNQTEISNAYNPPVRVPFNELRTEEVTDGADILFYKLKDFLVAHQQPKVRIEFVVMGVVCLIGALWFAVHNAGVNKLGNATIGSAPGFLACLAAFVVFAALGKIRNYVSLESTRDSGSFFVRNWEEFTKHAVKEIITVVVSALGGGIIGYYIGHSGK
jgi:hypothetical protein